MPRGFYLSCSPQGFIPPYSSAEMYLGEHWIIMLFMPATGTRRGWLYLF